MDRQIILLLGTFFMNCLCFFRSNACYFYQKRKCYLKKKFNLTKGKTFSGLFPIMWKLVCVEEADDISKERDRWHRHINMYSALVYGTRQKSYCICLKVLLPRPTLTAQRCFPQEAQSAFSGRLQLSLVLFLQMQHREKKIDSLLKAN